MFLVVSIYKEKKKEDFKIIIFPSGINKIGLIQSKNYGIISYLNKKEKVKLGEFILWALDKCDEDIIENNIKNFGNFFNLNSYQKVSSGYDFLDFLFNGNKYVLGLYMKNGYGYTRFKDKDGNECKYIFKEKPSAEELGEKVMEMFEFKENYDNSYK